MAGSMVLCCGPSSSSTTPYLQVRDARQQAHILQVRALHEQAEAVGFEATVAGSLVAAGVGPVGQRAGRRGERGRHLECVKRTFVG
jgi:hypothetical protein